MRSGIRASAMFDLENQSSSRLTLVTVALGLIKCLIRCS